MSINPTPLPNGYKYVDRIDVTPQEIMNLRKSIGWKSDTQEVWKDILADTLVFIGVKYHGELIGMTCVSGSLRHAVLCDLCVSPEHRGKKIGLALIKEQLRLSDELGISYLYAELSDENPFRRLLHDEGFKSTGSSFFRDKHIRG